MVKPVSLRTADLAKAIGVHPNTIRWYEREGFLPPIPRAPNGYRLFTEAHLDQLRLTRLALSAPAIGRDMQCSLRELVWLAAAGAWDLALKQGVAHLTNIQKELERATVAMTFLTHWKQGNIPELTRQSLSIQQAAQRISVLPHVLRVWEQYGLLQVPRHPHNRYRLYGSAEMGRLYVIRMLRQAGYTIEVCLRLMAQLDQWWPGQAVEATPREQEDLLAIAQQWQITLLAHQIRTQEIIAQLKEMRRRQHTAPV